MLLWTHVRVFPQEVVQDVQEGADVSRISSGLRSPYVFNDHVADPDMSARVVIQILCQAAGNGLGQVLVFGNREDLFLGQAAECNAVFKADHNSYLASRSLTPLAVS